MTHQWWPPTWSTSIQTNKADNPFISILSIGACVVQIWALKKKMCIIVCLDSVVCAVHSGNGENWLNMSWEIIRWIRVTMISLKPGDVRNWAAFNCAVRGMCLISGAFLAQPMQSFLYVLQYDVLFVCAIVCVVTFWFYIISHSTGVAFH